MAKEFSKKFYKSKQWLKCREGYIKQRVFIDGGMCERCKRDLGYILHHKILLTPSNITDPDITINYKNLEYICKFCHDEEHFIKKKRIVN